MILVAASASGSPPLPYRLNEPVSPATTNRHPGWRVSGLSNFYVDDPSPGHTLSEPRLDGLGSLNYSQKLTRTSYPDSWRIEASFLHTVEQLEQQTCAISDSPQTQGPLMFWLE